MGIELLLSPPDGGSRNLRHIRPSISHAAVNHFNVKLAKKLEKVNNENQSDDMKRAKKFYREEKIVKRNDFSFLCF